MNHLLLALNIVVSGSILVNQQFVLAEVSKWSDRKLASSTNSDIDSRVLNSYESKIAESWLLAVDSLEMTDESIRSLLIDENGWNWAGREYCDSSKMLFSGDGEYASVRRYETGWGNAGSASASYFTVADGVMTLTDGRMRSRPDAYSPYSLEIVSVTNSRIDFINSNGEEVALERCVIPSQESTSGRTARLGQAEESEILLRARGSLDSGDERLSDGSKYERHSFNGSTGQRISIQLSSSAFNTYLILLDPNGQKISENDDSSQETINSSITITLPSSGTYSVLANSYDDSGQGAYSLMVTYIDTRTTQSQQSLARLPSLETISDVVSESHHSGSPTPVPIDADQILLWADQGCFNDYYSQYLNVSQTNQVTFDCSGKNNLRDYARWRQDFLDGQRSSSRLIIINYYRNECAYSSRDRLVPYYGLKLELDPRPVDGIEYYQPERYIVSCSIPPEQIIPRLISGSISSSEPVLSEGYPCDTVDEFDLSEHAYLFSSSPESDPEFKDDWHNYSVETEICSITNPSCSRSAVYRWMLSQKRFVVPFIVGDEQYENIEHCSRSELRPQRAVLPYWYQPTIRTLVDILRDPDPVVTIVDANAFSATNYTVEGHALHPGRIMRSVIERNGTVLVRTVGMGTGPHREINKVSGQIIFSNVDQDLKDYVEEQIVEQD